MTIKNLYRDYFQKSRVFLYPALDIKRGVSVTPIQTHVAWTDHITPQDRKLVCLYHLRDDAEFTRFEKVKLLNNKLFCDFKMVEAEEGTCGVYIFDYSRHAEDWDWFLKGKYSKMSRIYKRRIMDFYGSYSPNFAYVESFLTPAKYFEIYSEILGIHVDELKKVGELCSIPDMKLETLSATLKDTVIKQKSI